MRGAILAGGGATRFGGRPKGLEQVGGARILDRLVDTFLAALGELPLLVANDPDAAAWHPGLDVLPDVHPGAGALGGILTAVSADARPVAHSTLASHAVGPPQRSRSPVPRKEHRIWPRPRESPQPCP